MLLVKAKSIVKPKEDMSSKRVLKFYKLPNLNIRLEFSNFINVALSNPHLIEGIWDANQDRQCQNQDGGNFHFEYSVQKLLVIVCQATSNGL